MKDYKIEFNGSETWMVIDIKNNDCLFATNTKRKAENYLDRYLQWLLLK